MEESQKVPEEGEILSTFIAFPYAFYAFEYIMKYARSLHAFHHAFLS